MACARVGETGGGWSSFSPACEDRVRVSSCLLARTWNSPQDSNLSALCSGVPPPELQEASVYAQAAPLGSFVMVAPVPQGNFQVRGCIRKGSPTFRELRAPCSAEQPVPSEPHHPKPTMPMWHKGHCVSLRGVQYRPNIHGTKSS